MRRERNLLASDAMPRVAHRLFADALSGGDAIVRDRVHRHEAAAWNDYRAAIAELQRL